MSDLKFQEGEAISAGKLNRALDYLVSLLPKDGRTRRSHISVLKTDSGGLTARSGTTLGEGTAKPMGRDGASVIESTGDSEIVYNLGSDAVSGSTYIQAVWWEGAWLANWEQC